MRELQSAPCMLDLKTKKRQLNNQQEAANDLWNVRRLFDPWET